jgi:hypothetical protein
MCASGQVVTSETIPQTGAASEKRYEPDKSINVQIHEKLFGENQVKGNS